MATGSTIHYRITPKAQTDLEDIWHYGAQTWSPEQADDYLDTLFDTFDTLQRHPEIARQRDEFTPAVRLHPCRNHLIVYTIEPDHILIVRLLGDSQNWQQLLQHLDD